MFRYRVLEEKLDWRLSSSIIAFDSRWAIALVRQDLSAAFDCTDVDILLRQLTWSL